MQKVFAEIRKHGNSGKHLSGGERSMLSGFQEAAQKIQEKDEYALVPFFRFYDTCTYFPDGSDPPSDQSVARKLLTTAMASNSRM
ncbi:MAG: hypothetical protein ACLTER_24430 [Ruminococcus sp.]